MVPCFETVPRETQERLSRYAALVAAENARQNLVSAATLPNFTTRHIDDALQLVPLLSGGHIVDIGSGAGLPGIPLACSMTHTFLLVEPRRRRAEFLTSVVDALGLSGRVNVSMSKVEAMAHITASTITARAVASLPDLFAAASHIAGDGTRWVLPKGRSARTELEEATKSWQGDFALVPSVTDPAASIVVAERVRRRR